MKGKLLFFITSFLLIIWVQSAIGGTILYKPIPQGWPVVSNGMVCMQWTITCPKQKGCVTPNRATIQRRLKKSNGNGWYNWQPVGEVSPFQQRYCHPLTPADIGRTYQYKILFKRGQMNGIGRWPDAILNP